MVSTLSPPAGWRGVRPGTGAWPAATWGSLPAHALAQTAAARTDQENLASDSARTPERVTRLLSFLNEEPTQDQSAWKNLFRLVSNNKDSARLIDQQSINEKLFVFISGGIYTYLNAQRWSCAFFLKNFRYSRFPKDRLYFWRPQKSFLPAEMREAPTVSQLKRLYRRKTQAAVAGDPPGPIEVGETNVPHSQNILIGVLGGPTRNVSKVRK